MTGTQDTNSPPPSGHDRRTRLVRSNGPADQKCAMKQIAGATIILAVKSKFAHINFCDDVRVGFGS